MKNLWKFLVLLLTSMLLSNLSTAQWINTSGADGGRAYSIVSVPNGSGGSDLYAGLTGGSVAHSTDDGASWNQ